MNKPIGYEWGTQYIDDPRHQRVKQAVEAVIAELPPGTLEFQPGQARIQIAALTKRSLLNTMQESSRDEIGVFFDTVATSMVCLAIIACPPRQQGRVIIPESGTAVQLLVHPERLDQARLLMEHAIDRKPYPPYITQSN